MELLKLRFGETSLHLCEVMLKDIVDSKRVDNVIHSTDPNKAVSFSPSESTYIIIAVAVAVTNAPVLVVVCCLFVSSGHCCVFVKVANPQLHPLSPLLAHISPRGT